MLKLLGFLTHCFSGLFLLFLIGMSIISKTTVSSTSFLILFLATLTVIYVFNQPIEAKVNDSDC